MLENELNSRCSRENFIKKNYRCILILAKNLDLQIKEAIYPAITNGIMNSINSSLLRDPVVLRSYSYAPIVSGDVERSFSKYLAFCRKRDIDGGFSILRKKQKYEWIFFSKSKYLENQTSNCHTSKNFELGELVLDSFER